MRALLAALILAPFLALAAAPQPVQAQGQGPLRLEITEGVIEPLPIAIAPFLAERSTRDLAAAMTQVVTADLTGSGLFRAIPPAAFISPVSSFDAPVQYADWRAINAQGLVAAEVVPAGRGRIAVRFRLYDVFSGAPLGEGLQFTGAEADWRRIAHKVADAVYSRITGESGYFDSRVVFVAESGPKDDRRKRLAIMDYDGANLGYLTDGSDLVLGPRISRDGSQVLYTSYASGFPRMRIMDTRTLRARALEDQPGTMTFSPRFSPDGGSVLYSLSTAGNTDLYTMSLTGGGDRRLTSAPSIETAPSYAPDGRQIVFESDRSGTQQLYVMPAAGGEARRISFGAGRYGTPVWSPRGDYIAFTKQHQGRFHIGVMRTDGSEERLLTASFLDESPTWAPNGRVLMFARQSAGDTGAAQLYSVDITGRNLRQVPTPAAASDPAWSPLRD